ncbi:MAG: hypothetical protein NUW08_03560 [Candidatus Uhrbacteria bacterium]|nr:hypothetical protein [Candidatus Uhrbacteria bacterium]
MQRRPGFTLVETLIYTAFVGTIMVSMTLLAYSTFTIRSRVRASIILQENIRFAVGRTTHLVNEAEEISSPGFGITDGTLVLVTNATSTNPTTFTTVDGTVFVTQGVAGTPEALTSEEVFISNLSFTRVSSTSDMIRMVASGGLRNAAPSYPTITVTTTAAVRR